ncbi:hypothetical protein DITRI_Ditri05aG0141500 [Diplodiscus trichospermus]
MAVAFTQLSWWLWSGKQQEPRIANGSLSSSPDSGLWESDNLKFPLVKRANVASSSRRVKRKWHSREERKIDREYDVVLVPSDGGCVSGSESDGSDYSVGWLEPHGPGFQSDDDSENSFAVLVPCYGRSQDNMMENSRNNILGAIVNIPDNYSAAQFLRLFMAPEFENSKQIHQLAFSQHWLSIDNSLLWPIAQPPVVIVSPCHEIDLNTVGVGSGFLYQTIGSNSKFKGFSLVQVSGNSELANQGNWHGDIWKSNSYNLSQSKDSTHNPGEQFSIPSLPPFGAIFTSIVSFMIITAITFVDGISSSFPSR